MNATVLLADLRTAGIAVRVHAGRLKLDAPRGALTESVLSAVRDSKVELLKLLEPAAPTPGVALFSHGLGARADAATPTRAWPAPAESIAQTARLGDDPKVDTEFTRFARVARPMPGGGLYCPVHGSPIMPSGVSGERRKAEPHG